MATSNLNEKVLKGLNLRIRTCGNLWQSVQNLSVNGSATAYNDADRAHDLAVANLTRYAERHGVKVTFDMTRGQQA